MNINNFKTNYRVNIENNQKIKKSSTYNNINAIIKGLGLYPLPENIQASISDDNKYLNINLKDSVAGEHLNFQFPLNEKNLVALRNRADYQELQDRYHLYINDYMDEIKQYAIEEAKYLKEKFTGLEFTIKLRIKSYYSYINKINQHILDGKDPYINDIAAERIIILGYNGSQDEELLSKICDKVAKALYDFRINTNFRMKEDLKKSQFISDKEYISKDYIEIPKVNGYQSLHIIMQNKYNSDIDYETQIRTFYMEKNSKSDTNQSHSKAYKPRILNDLSPNRVPYYLAITSFNDKKGNPIIYSPSLKERFYHFYNQRCGDEPHGSVPSITYERFRDEQHKIEKAIGMEFKFLRQKLVELDRKKQSIILE